ncbi:Phosphate regulon sensor protein PhoR (SphS) [Desulfosporosinus sp. I2]|uniref:sensor histidine kinase n=1 Tax=Desulfosporosinus sp. I2 TaxID=1617025 RepID=UPI0005EEBB56|nr:HAMP domain-containing sensor histidine kinase [Desulfosporosinus sp. I2]KJR45495.1 Phosphate regulon sensor protein PhoR (SphS) [Desulfosporosinus sp. I2]
MKTIFTKLVGSYILIVVISLVVIGVSLSFMFNNYLFEQKERELIIKGQDMAQVVKPFLVEKEDPHDFVNMANRLDLNLGTEVWVVDKKGAVIATAANHEYCEGNYLEASELKKMQSGSISVYKGKSQYFQEPVIRVIIPIIQEEKVIGAIVLYSPIQGINKALASLSQLVLTAGIISLAIAFLIGIILSRRLSRPILTITEASTLIAKGQKQVTVPTDTSIEEINQLGKTFNDMSSKVEANEERMKEFVANVSHELRSPLTSIKGFIEALIDNKGKTPEAQQRFLTIINDETDRLSQLVNDLLILSRSEEEIFLKPEEIELKKFIEDVLTSFQPRAEENSITMEVISEETSIFLKIDLNSLKQIIVNLVDNALKYSTQGGNVSISLKESAEMISISISDSGLGIPERDLPHIWDRFYRVDKDRSRETGGTGLGLAIVKQLTEKNGGQVEVESVLGKGSVFSVRF